MKNLLLFLSLFFVADLAFGQGDAPPFVQGQAQASKSVATIIQVPNSLATKTSASKTLIETGNKNILQNPSFEAVVNGPITGWAQTGIVSANVETTVVFDGKSSVDLSSPNQALDFHQDSTLYQAQFADGPQGLAMMRVKTTCTDAPIYVCPRTAGAYPSQKTSGCVQVQPTGKWKLYKTPFLLGGTSNGIGITSNGSAITCDTYIDDAFVGAVDLKQDVDQSRIAGSAYFPGTVSCSWSRTSTTQGPFPATTACPGPTIEYSSMGSWQTTDSDLPRVTVNNLPSGVYKASFYFSNTAASGQGPTFSINDGTTSCTSSIGSESGSYSGVVITCTFNYTSSGDRVFELYVSTATGTVTIDNTLGTGYKRNTKFILEYFGKGSVYSTTNANYSRTSFVPVFQGITTSATDCYHSRDGQFLDVDCKITVATSSASELHIGLPIVNGAQLNSANSSGIRVAGVLTSNESSSAPVNNLLIEPLTAYFTAGTRPSTSTAAFTKVTGSGYISAGSILDFVARIPIDTWDNSNIIIGQFNGLESCSDSYQCTDTFSAKVSNTDVVSDENLEWITGNCTNATTGDSTCAFKTGLFTNPPNCTVTPVTGATQVYFLTVPTSSGFSVETRNSAGTASDSAYNIVCQKTGADAIFKSARAVASDQNTAAPGVTKSVEYWFDVAAAGTVSNESGDLVNGNCTNAAPSVCTFNNGKFASSSPVRCWASTNEGSNYTCYSYSESSTGLSLNCFSAAGGGTTATTSASKKLLCKGYAP